MNESETLSACDADYADKDLLQAQKDWSGGFIIRIPAAVAIIRLLMNRLR